MSTSTECFSGRAAEYERYRQRYQSEQILPLLRDWCGLTAQHLVADIGAGTGMLAEIFLENGNEVIAVEPNQEMRTLCETLVERWPRLSVINTTAEQTGLNDSSIDLISVGRAFHWFDRFRALKEFRRILKPGGWVALISAGRNREKTPQARAFEQLLIDHGTDQDYRSRGYRVHERMDELFPEGEVRRVEIAGEQGLTFEEFIGQTMSFSVVPLPGHPKHEDMVHALHDFFARYAMEGLITIPTTCWVTCGRLAASH
jgi:ubiquinone/menaquinone biosynthesis C-methylase UbiE